MLEWLFCLCLLNKIAVKQISFNFVQSNFKLGSKKVVLKHKVLNLALTTTLKYLPKIKLNSVNTHQGERSNIGQNSFHAHHVSSWNTQNKACLKDTSWFIIKRSSKRLNCIVLSLTSNLTQHNSQLSRHNSEKWAVKPVETAPDKESAACWRILLQRAWSWIMLWTRVSIFRFKRQTNIMLMCDSALPRGLVHAVTRA